jgi:hypothetical protein
MRRRGGSEQPVKGRRANRPKARKVLTAAPSMADLKKTGRQPYPRAERRKRTADSDRGGVAGHQFIAWRPRAGVSGDA